jgi:hypothetical protein
VPERLKAVGFRDTRTVRKLWVKECFEVQHEIRLPSTNRYSFAWVVLKWLSCLLFGGQTVNTKLFLYLLTRREYMSSGDKAPPILSLDTTGWTRSHFPAPAATLALVRYRH